MTHLIVLALVVAAPPAPFAAKVIGISDGDTITVLKAKRSQVRNRLNGVDAPESGQLHRSKKAQEPLILILI